MDGYLLGIDAGQTAMKATLHDLEGREVGAASGPTIVSSPAPRHQERAMPAVWDQCARTIRACLSAAGVSPSSVLGVGIAGHGDGAYLVDDELRPVRPAILATDSRAYAEAAALTATTARRLLELTGQVPYPGATSAILPWLATHEPEALARTRFALSCKDWLRLCLTGTVATDATDASGAFWDVNRQEWSAEAFGLAGLPAFFERTAPVVGSSAVAGTVTGTAAGATGLQEGTPVVGGAHDVDAAALGIGAVGAGALSIVLGTFSINQVVASAPSVDGRWQARTFLRPGTWLHMSTSPAGAANLDWALRRLGPVTGSGEPDHAAAFVEVEASLAATPASAAPLYLPYLYGSPHSAALAGGLLGIRGWHTRGDLLRAVVVGVVSNHRFHCEALAEALTIRGPARVCGGGARSPVWCQLLADAIGRPVEVTDSNQAGARGAAMLAGLGVGIYADLDDAVGRCVRLARVHAPDATGRERADTAYARHRRAVAALEDGA
jgi:L-xylulokinase